MLMCFVSRGFFLCRGGLPAQSGFTPPAFKTWRQGESLKGSGKQLGEREDSVGVGRVKIVIAEDHGLVAEAFEKLLEPEFDVVGIVGDASALLWAARELKPDVVLLDLNLPGTDGIDAGEQLKRAMPRVKIIVVTVNDDVKTPDARWTLGRRAMC